MCHRNCFGFQDPHLFGKYLCEPVDKEGMPTRLFVNGFNHFRGKRLPGFISILPKQLLHLDKRKIA